MKIVARIVGYMFLVIGLVWIVTIMGGVFSHQEGFTSLDLLWGGLAFHTVSMGLGVFFLGLARKPRAAAEVA